MQLYILWIIMAAVMIVTEMFTAGFAALCFSIGFLAIAAGEFFGMAYAWQAVLFSAVSLAVFFTLKPFAKKYLYKTTSVKDNVDGMMGRTAKVVQTIDNEAQKGEVKLDGDIWRARSLGAEVINEGEDVKIEKLDGNTVFVKLKQK